MQPFVCKRTCIQFAFKIRNGVRSFIPKISHFILSRRKTYKQVFKVTRNDVLLKWTCKENGGKKPLKKEIKFTKYICILIISYLSFYEYPFPPFLLFGMTSLHLIF